LLVAGELEGQGLRVGKIAAEDTDGVLPIRAGSRIEFRDAQFANLSGGEKFVPVPGICSIELVTGSKIVYGDHKCIFEVVELTEGRIVALAQSSDEIASTRSIYVTGVSTPQMTLDQKNMNQLDFIIGNDEFDIVILPNVSEIGLVQDVEKRVRRSRQDLKIACRLSASQPVSFIEEAASICDYLILDRSDMALAHGAYSVPKIVRNMLPSDLSRRAKIIIASQVAQSASRGAVGLLSAAEISDAWSILEQGVGGFLLAEETAVDGNGVSAVRQISTLIDVFMSHG
jgi:pyruvate kinase